MNKVLFISGPIGLGHVSRELEIVKEMRKLDPNVEIIWHAEEPAASMLRSAGEGNPYTYSDSKSTTSFADAEAHDYNLSLCTMFLEWLKTFPDRVGYFMKIVAEQGVDTIVGDETMEVLLTLANKPELKQFKFVYLSDFFGAYQVRMKPKEMIATHIFNKTWTKFMENPDLYEKFIFIGEKEDIDEGSMGLFLPKRRDLAYKNVEFVGNILPFRPEDYMDKVAMKRKLGYDQKPLIICTAGGSSAGKPLLNLCSKSYLILKKDLPDAQMKIVCGPRIPTHEIVKEDGVDIAGYVPNLYEHFAAADLVITSGGGSSTLELTALQKPFLYFPILQHWEQNRDVARKCERYGAGIRMDYSTTTPLSLSKAIQENVGKEVHYPKIPVDGAAKTAKLIMDVRQGK
jgi:UDP-N-acetylglucosamine:LPS N-acetylglucosamine transferase